MLISPHERGHAVGQRQTEAVGAHLPFGIGEPGCEVDVVERFEQAAVTGQPGQHDALGIGEHQADRFADERAVQISQHFIAALKEQGT